MTEEIRQFDTWLSTAKSGDKYTYFTGNLAYSIGLADGYSLKQLSQHILNKCCKWNLEATTKKATDNKIQFNQPAIRVVQKARKKYWDKKQKDVLNGCDYIVVKL